MSTAPVPVPAVPQPRRAAPAWPRTSAPWAALAIATMWVTVLLVGLFGGDIVNETPGGTSSRIPGAVAVALLALLATVFVARWGLRSDAPLAELQLGLDDERHRREALEAEVDELRRAAAERRPDAAR